MAAAKGTKKVILLSGATGQITVGSSGSVRVLRGMFVLGLLRRVCERLCHGSCVAARTCADSAD